MRLCVPRTGTVLESGARGATDDGQANRDVEVGLIVDLILGGIFQGDVTDVDWFAN